MGIFRGNRAERVKARKEGRAKIINARTEKVKARAEVARHRKWSFMAMAVIAVVVALLYYTGGFAAIVSAAYKLYTLFKGSGTEEEVVSFLFKV